MSISAKHFNIINNIMEDSYSLISEGKGKATSPLFYFKNKEDNSNVFLKIEQYFDFYKKQKEFYSIMTGSISSFFSIKSFEKEQKIFKDITIVFNDMSSFLKPYLKNFNFKYSEFQTTLYKGSILKIDKDFKKSVGFWLTTTFNDNGKFSKIAYIRIEKDKLFFDFEEVSIEEFEKKLNLLILTDASKNISNMQPLKNIEGNKLEIRNIFKLSHSVKEMVDY